MRKYAKQNKKSTRCKISKWERNSKLNETKIEMKLGRLNRFNANKEIDETKKKRISKLGNALRDLETNSANRDTI